MKMRVQRITVSVHFDARGIMYPREIVDDVGRRIPISRVRAIQPAVSMKNGAPGDRYTVYIGGRECYMYFVHNPDYGNETPGYWLLRRDDL